MKVLRYCLVVALVLVMWSAVALATIPTFGTTKITIYDSDVPPRGAHSAKIFSQTNTNGYMCELWTSCDVFWNLSYVEPFGLYNPRGFFVSVSWGPTSRSDGGTWDAYSYHNTRDLSVPDSGRATSQAHKTVPMQPPPPIGASQVVAAAWSAAYGDVTRSAEVSGFTVYSYGDLFTDAVPRLTRQQAVDLVFSWRARVQMTPGDWLPLVAVRGTDLLVRVYQVKVEGLCVLTEFTWNGTHWIEVGTADNVGR